MTNLRRQILQGRGGGGGKRIEYNMSLFCSPTISGLLSMAEAFLNQLPPKVSEAVRCLLAVLSLHPPPRIEAKTRLELGLTLFHHTNNLIEAREHLDKAVSCTSAV